MLEKRKLKKALKANDITAARRILRSNPYLTDIGVLLLVGRCGAPAMAEMFAQETHVQVDLNKEKWTFLHIIAEFHYVEAARIAIARYPDIVNKQTKDDITPLHIAAAVGDVQMITLLVASHADVNAVSGDGCAPLHNAARRGHVVAFEKLLSLGANADLRDEKGRTPLDDAVMYGRCSAAVIENLRSVQAGFAPLPASAEVAVSVALPPSPWHVVDDCTIAYTREDAVLGYRLTDIFNFGIGRCISLQHDLKTGAQTAVSVDMTEIGARALLLHARDELCARGHTPPPLLLTAPQPLLKKPQAGHDV